MINSDGARPTKHSPIGGHSTPRALGRAGKLLLLSPAQSFLLYWTMKKRRYPLIVALLIAAGTIALFAPLDSSLHPQAWVRKETYPQQIRLSRGERADQIVVTFASPFEGSSLVPHVAYGTQSQRYTTVAFGESKHFGGEWNEKGLQWIHSVMLEGLDAGTKYYYVAKIGNHSSEEFSFFVPPAKTDAGPSTFIVFGDLGFIGGATTIDHIVAHELGGSTQPAAAIHIGDIAYHLYDDRGMEGDLFFQKIEPLAARIPYMTCVGNHERSDGYQHYKKRFMMPGAAKENGNMWYSWDSGLVHFVAISTDHIDQRDHVFIAKQNQWLARDLEEANSRRNVTPWIVVYAHHPMYCSNTGEYCRDDAPFVRDTLEDIFQTYGVDVFISAHQHSYERLWPVVKGKVVAKHYNDPPSSLQVISGSGGCPLTHGFCFDPTVGPRGPWSALRWWFPGVFGYDRMTVHNATHLSWEHILAGTGKVVDKATLRRTRHGPFL